MYRFQFGFQALIGTVETWALTGWFDLDYDVSSPHRYCRNRCPRPLEK